jgi:two-component system, OmpR family, response regulator
MIAKADRSFSSAILSSPKGPARPIRILFIDDDPSMQEMVKDYFAEQNVRVVAAGRSAEAARQLAISIPDLIILDTRLGDEDGFELLREIRSYSNVPIIIATGHLCDEIDRVVGLELGADGYITKPFGLRELLARVRAVLRRQHSSFSDTKRSAAEGRSSFGSWHLDRRSRRLADSSGNQVPLSKGEYGLLLAFLDSPQRPLTREHLLQATRLHEDIFDRSIDVQVLRLRRKLEIDSAAPQIILTERGVGYVFALPVEHY